MEPHWTAYISAFATPVVAALGILIAYRQWATARDKLRLDLYERRLVVYQGARTVIDKIFMRSRISVEDEMEYRNSISGVQWLFGKEVQEYLEQTFWSRLENFQELQDGLDVLESPNEKNIFGQEKMKLRDWFIAQDKRLEQLFMPYLNFQHRA